jgi:hypothetical protein
MRRRNTIFALDAPAEAAEVGSVEALVSAHREWIEEALASEAHRREEAWTKSIAGEAKGLSLRPGSFSECVEKVVALSWRAIPLCFVSRKKAMGPISAPKLRP